MDVRDDIGAEDSLTRANVAGVLEHELAKRKALIRVLRKECKELDAALASLKAIDRPKEQTREETSVPVTAGAPAPNPEAQAPKRRRGRPPKAASTTPIRTAGAGSVWMPTRRRGRPRKQVAAPPPKPHVTATPTAPPRPRPSVDSTDTFARIATAAESKEQPIRVPCITCGEKFPNARDLGIHRTRVHFSVESSTEVN